MDILTSPRIRPGGELEFHRHIGGLRLEDRAGCRVCDTAATSYERRKRMKWLADRITGLVAFFSFWSSCEVADMVDESEVNWWIRCKSRRVVRPKGSAARAKHF